MRLFISYLFYIVFCERIIAGSTVFKSSRLALSLSGCALASISSMGSSSLIFLVLMLVVSGTSIRLIAFLFSSIVLVTISLVAVGKPELSVLESVAWLILEKDARGSSPRVTYYGFKFD